MDSEAVRLASGPRVSILRRGGRAAAPSRVSPSATVEHHSLLCLGLSWFCSNDTMLPATQYFLAEKRHLELIIFTGLSTLYESLMAHDSTL